MNTRLFSAGYELNTAPYCFGTFRRSEDIASDTAALRARIKEDGYLFLPGFFKRSTVLDARRVVTDRLAETGVLDLSHPSIQAKANLASSIDFGPEIGTLDNPSLDAILHRGPMMDFFAGFLGGTARYFEYTWFRTIPPGRGTRPHCDVVYMGRGTKKLFTAWVPIGDISLQTGGLMILEHSHRKANQLQGYTERDVDEYCLNAPDAEEIATGRKSWQWDGALSNNPVLLREELGDRWLTTKFSAGDLVVFTMSTVHGSLDNCSDRIRLSVDCRYQLASEPIDERWIGKRPIARGLAAKRGRIC
jgi:hypothetical protein